MKKKKVLILILLAFMMVTPVMKADFWSKLRDAFIGGDNYSSSSSSSSDKNIVDGKIYNPKDNREYRLVEKMKEKIPKVTIENLKIHQVKLFIMNVQ